MDTAEKEVLPEGNPEISLWASVRVDPLASHSFLCSILLSLLSNPITNVLPAPLPPKAYHFTIFSYSPSASCPSCPRPQHVSDCYRNSCKALLPPTHPSHDSHGFFLSALSCCRSAKNLQRVLCQERLALCGLASPFSSTVPQSESSSFLVLPRPSSSTPCGRCQHCLRVLLFILAPELVPSSFPLQPDPPLHPSSCLRSVLPVLLIRMFGPAQPVSLDYYCLFSNRLHILLEAVIMSFFLSVWWSAVA